MRGQEDIDEYGKTEDYYVNIPHEGSGDCKCDCGPEGVPE